VPGGVLPARRGGESDAPRPIAVDDEFPLLPEVAAVRLAGHSDPSRGTAGERPRAATHSAPVSRDYPHCVRILRPLRDGGRPRHGLLFFGRIIPPRFELFRHARPSPFGASEDPSTSRLSHGPARSAGVRHKRAAGTGPECPPSDRCRDSALRIPTPCSPPERLPVAPHPLRQTAALVSVFSHRRHCAAALQHVDHHLGTLRSILFDDLAIDGSATAG
jgi:hypothetical protein